MKKVLALIVALMMIVSMIPVMAIPAAAADVPGDWDTYRSAGGYEEPEEGEDPSYTPAPGYEYTEEGFHMISADYAGCTPFGTIQSKEPVSIKDGVYMELRVDEYAYGGESGTADHWIAFSIWDSQKIAPGNVTDYGQGWLDLTRTPGNGGAGSAQSFICSSEGAGTFGHQGDVSVTPEVDENGKEIYTFEISYDGTNYTIAICGVPVQGGVNITNHLNKLNADGEFYVGVTFHTGAAATKLEATMLKFGTSADDATVPTGSDSKEPEENINVTAEIADPDTVPENQPALLFDATEKTCTNKFGTSAMELIPQGNNSFKVEPSAAVGFHQWPIKKSLSYDAKDFPVIAVFIEDPNEIVDSGVIRYSAGDNMSADDVHVLTYSIWDDNCKYYGENEEYTLVVIDMRELLDEAALEEGWNGRINGLRFDYGSLYLSNPVDPETDYFFFHYAGIFRSVEEAYAYNEEYAASLGLTEAEPETDEPVDETDEPATGDAGETNPPAGETNAPAGETDAATKAPETTAPKSGCSGVIGSVAVLMTAAAAAVVLKKRD